MAQTQSEFDIRTIIEKVRKDQPITESQLAILRGRYPAIPDEHIQRARNKGNSSIPSIYITGKSGAEIRA